MEKYYTLVSNLFIQFKDEIISISIFSLFLFFLYLLIAKFLSLLLRTSVKLFHFDRAETILKTIKLIIKFILFFILFIFILKQFKLDVNAILTGAGALGAILILIFQIV